MDDLTVAPKIKEAHGMMSKLFDKEISIQWIPIPEELKELTGPGPIHSRSIFGLDMVPSECLPILTAIKESKTLYWDTLRGIRDKLDPDLSKCIVPLKRAFKSALDFQADLDRKAQNASTWVSNGIEKIKTPFETIRARLGDLNVFSSGHPKVYEALEKAYQLIETACVEQRVSDAASFSVIEHVLTKNDVVLDCRKATKGSLNDKLRAETIFAHIEMLHCLELSEKLGKVGKANAKTTNGDVSHPTQPRSSNVPTGLSEQNQLLLDSLRMMVEPMVSATLARLIPTSGKGKASQPRSRSRGNLSRWIHDFGESPTTSTQKSMSRDSEPPNPIPIHTIDDDASSIGGCSTSGDHTSTGQSSSQDGRNKRLVSERNMSAREEPPKTRKKPGPKPGFKLAKKRKYIPNQYGKNQYD